jgi:DNA mismatch endonuclease (patch repair protein)
MNGIVRLLQRDSILKNTDILTDIVLPDKKIAVFVDGTIWHGDPLCFNSDDILPYRNKVIKDVWKKDLRNSEYLRSQGFIVLRFWEREIMSNIQKCLETILAHIASEHSESNYELS